MGLGPSIAALYVAEVQNNTSFNKSTNEIYVIVEL